MTGGGPPVRAAAAGGRAAGGPRGGATAPATGRATRAAAAALARLVADGVLEIERETGLYLSGGAALPLFAETPPAGGAGLGRGAVPVAAAGEVAVTGGNRLARLSLAALRYGEDRARLE